MPNQQATPTFNPEFANYEEWRRANPNITKTLLPCPNPECDEGSVGDYGFNYGNEICEVCEGRGGVFSTRAAYEKRLDIDKAKLARYRANKPVFDEGMWFGEMVEVQNV